MLSDFQARIEEVERLVRYDGEQVGKRAGVPFIVFIYDPANEIEVDEEVRNLIDKLEYRDQTVAGIDMRELVFDVLEDRGILENVIDLERRDRDQLLDGLKSSLLDDGEMGQLASAIATRAEDADTVIVTEWVSVPVHQCLHADGTIKGEYAGRYAHRVLSSGKSG